MAFSSSRKRKSSKINQNELKKKVKIEVDSSIENIEDEEECPSSYEVLINSLPSKSKYRFCSSEPDPAPIPGPLSTEQLQVHIEQQDRDSDSDGDEIETSSEPFSCHYEYTLKDKEVEQLTSHFSRPVDIKSEQNELGLVEWTTTPTSRTEWIDPTKRIKSLPLTSMHIRQPMATNWKGGLSPFQSQLFNVFNSYKDFLYSSWTSSNAPELRRAYVLHALNHVIKSRSRVLKNNAKLASSSNDSVSDCLDQGLTRPKVLILLPFKSCAVKIIEAMSDIMFSSGKGEISKKKRFMEEFGSGSDGKPPAYKPKSYLEMFEGNTDDCFKIGVSIKKNSINLYKQFYSSDLILASPLGLRIIIGGEGDKERDYDFLSSLEIIIVDQMDVFLMQNWDHLTHVFDHTHLQPKSAHSVDFSRVREWALNGIGQFYCQNIFISSFLTPEINSLAMKRFRCYEGQVRVLVPSWAGSVCQVMKPVPQVFHRFKSPSCKDLADCRFSFFVDNIIPKLLGPLMDQTCVYIPSYFDFVRVRNYLKKEEIDFSMMTEYTKSSSISRARSFFTAGRKRLLLLTERLHFFRRYRLSGIHHLVFYGLPTYHEFYPELINMMEPDPTASVLTVYSKYDILALQRIVGSGNACGLLKCDDAKQTVVTGR